MEGCYIPFDWKADFEEEYLQDIRYYCLVMSRAYIEKHFSDIRKYASVIEERLDDTYCTMETVLSDNEETLRGCIAHDCPYILIEDEYRVDIEV